MARRGQLLDLAIAAAAGIALGVALGAHLLEPGPPPTFGHVTSASSQTVHTEARLVGHDLPYTLHRLPYNANGGTARIEWYDGAWSPTRPNSGSVVSLFLDGKRLASGLAGGYTGWFEARPGSVVWVGPISSGEHVVEARVESAGGNWAIPAATPDTPVPDGLTITEWW